MVLWRILRLPRAIRDRLAWAGNSRNFRGYGNIWEHQQPLPRRYYQEEETGGSSKVRSRSGLGLGFRDSDNDYDYLEGFETNGPYARTGGETLDLASQFNDRRLSDAARFSSETNLRERPR